MLGEGTRFAIQFYRVIKAFDESLHPTFVDTRYRLLFESFGFDS